MLEMLKNVAELALTENGAVTNSTSGSDCLDLFFLAGAMRNRPEADIARAVTRAFAEDAARTLKIVFFARDVRGGLGERRFFRAAIKTLAVLSPAAVERNVPFIAEYGRYDDLCALLHTPCEAAAVSGIRKQLEADRLSMQNGGQVSLLAKWLPSVNASSQDTRKQARHLAALLGLTERNYRKLLSSLRSYTDILENRLRTKDYTFDYEKQPSKALFKYRQAFDRNDHERYFAFLDAVEEGRSRLNASTLYPYEVVRRCLDYTITPEEKRMLDLTWRSLPAYGEQSENAIAVIDGSGSMMGACPGNVRPIDAALSLGLYFAEHNTGAFAGHFITFSETPQLVETKGADITEKVRYCATFDEVANTNLEAVFDLILRTALRHKLSQAELPHRVYIITDMEFDACVTGNEDTLCKAMEKRYKEAGYTLPQVVFWNVNSRSDNYPVKMCEDGKALVSGFSPVLFDMLAGDELTPIRVMEEIISSERYAKIG